MKEKNFMTIALCGGYERATGICIHQPESACIHYPYRQCGWVDADPDIGARITSVVVYYYNAHNNITFT